MTGSVLGLKDYRLELAKGVIPRHTIHHVRGWNTAVAASTAEDLWDVGTATISFASTADCTHIKSSNSGDTNKTIRLVGLDTNWALTDQTKDLDGTDATTLVALTTGLRRVFSMEVQETTAPTGNITCENSGGTTTYAQITAGNNRTYQGTYTVPASAKGYVDNLSVTIVEGTSAQPDSVRLELWSLDRETGYVEQMQEMILAELTGLPQVRKEFLPIQFAAKTDLWVTAVPFGTDGGSVFGGFDLIVVTDA